MYDVMENLNDVLGYIDVSPVYTNLTPNMSPKPPQLFPSSFQSLAHPP